MNLQPLPPDQYPQVDAIYREGIVTGQATFRTEGKSWDEWNAGHLPVCRFVAVDGNTDLGWAALSPVSSRPVYAGVAEVSVYIAEQARGRSVGKALLAALVTASEAAGLWTLQAGIFPENVASNRLHEGCGFRTVGRRERIGRMHTGQWRDTVLLERRSQVEGFE